MRYNTTTQTSRHYAMPTWSRTFSSQDKISRPLKSKTRVMAGPHRFHTSHVDWIRCHEPKTCTRTRYRNKGDNRIAATKTMTIVIAWHIRF